MKIAAQFFSALLHPLLMPFYGIILILSYSILFYIPWINKLTIAGIFLLFTAFIPALNILIFYKTKLISTIGLNNRKERTLPYFVIMCSLIALGYICLKLNMPLFLLAFIAGGFLSIVIAYLINLKWKISAHMTGIAGVISTMFVFATHSSLMNPLNRLPLWLICLTIILTGVLGTSRIILNRHTLGQVIGGTINGVMCVWFTYYLYFLIR